MAHKHRETSSQHPQSHVKRKGREKLDHFPGEDQHSTQILELRRKLRSAEERILNLQLRNRAVLDDLDDLRASSAADNEQARKEIFILGRRCAVLQEEAERTGREKEDMNDALRLLVEKVEACNADFSAWKPTNLRMSRSLSILPQHRDTSTTSESCSCPRAYGPAIVAELSQLLAREREAHAETIFSAEQRLAHYEAAIARREADLACVLEACHCEAASVVAASFNEIGTTRSQTLSSRDKVDRTLAVEVLNLRREIQTENALQEKRRRTTPPPSPPKSTGISQSEQPPPSTIVPPEPDLLALARQIDSLRAQVQRLSSEKSALQRLVQAEFPSNSSISSHRSPTRHESDLNLLEENARLREALARTQRHHSTSSRSHSLPSPAIHMSSMFPAGDPFRSPVPHSSAIDESFPPLTPDHSTSAASTSIHGYSPYDNVESLFPLDVPEVIPLPLSPLLSPLSPVAGPSGSQPRSRAHSPWQTPLDMSLCSTDSDEAVEEESPTLRAAALLRQQREAELQVQLDLERREADLREREMLELRETITSLAFGSRNTESPSALPGFTGGGGGGPSN